MSDSDAFLSLEPEDLDGHSVDELADYLARGREPADPSIDNSPACQIALGALQRLQEATGVLLAGDDDAAAPRTDEDWIAGAIASLSLEAHAGRRFPVPEVAERLRAVVTEGALRGLIRATGDAVPGLLVGSVRIVVDDPPVVGTVRMDVALVFGFPLRDADAQLREALAVALPDHVPFRIERIDVRVVDVVDVRRQGQEP